MALYSVHIRSRADDRDAVLVREGFSRPAFVFTVAWALWHRLWLVAAGVATLFAGLGLAFQLAAVDPLLQSVLIMSFNFVLGSEASRLRRWTLRRAGYHNAGMTAGDSLEEAELRYFNARRPAELPTTTPPMKLAPMKFGQDPLGLFGPTG